MTRYIIIGPIVLSFIEGNLQKDYLLTTGTLEVEGSTLWLVNSQGRFESITQTSIIPAALKQGRLLATSVPPAK